jgi:hypothetical protein
LKCGAITWLQLQKALLSTSVFSKLPSPFAGMAINNHSDDAVRHDG